jgi:hypothetical protein
MFRRVLPGLSLLLLLGAAACSSAGARTEQGYGQVKIRTETLPGEVSPNTSFDFVMEIQGPALEQVRVDALMPDSRTRMLKDVEVERLPDGRWIARGMLLHLPGSWEVTVDLTYNGRERHFTFPIRL